MKVPTKGLRDVEHEPKQPEQGLLSLGSFKCLTPLPLHGSTPPSSLEKLLASSIEKKTDELNILLGIGGSGPTKRIPAKTFINVIKMMTEKTKCKFFLATGKDSDEQLILSEILKSKFKNLCV